MPGERKKDRALRVGERDLPGHGCFDGIGRAEVQEPWNAPEAHQVLDRLVRGAILAKPDGVMGEDEDHREPHERGEPNGRPHVVRKNQEGATEGADPAVQGHPIQDRAHGVLADPEVDRAAARCSRKQRVGSIQIGLVRGAQIGRAPDKLGHPGRKGVQHLPRHISRGGRADGLGKVWDGRRPSIGEGVRHGAGELPGQLGMSPSVLLEALLPVRRERLACPTEFTPVGVGLGGHEEGLLAGVAIRCLGQADLFVAQRRAMGIGCPSLVGASPGNGGAKGDERRAIHLGIGGAEGPVESPEIIAILNYLDVPAVAFEAAQGVGGDGEVRGPLNGDVVVVEDPEEPTQFLVAGEFGGLVGDPLHEIAVRAEGNRAVMDDLVAWAVEVARHPALGQRHPHRVGDPLAKWTRCGLDPWGVVQLRVSGGLASPLAEVSNFLFGQVVPRQVEQRVEEHGRMTHR